MKVDTAILDNALVAALADDYVGFCLKCGQEQDDVEPDAEKYECESCGEAQVYGAEQIVLLGQ